MSISRALHWLIPTMMNIGFSFWYMHVFTTTLKFVRCVFLIIAINVYKYIQILSLWKVQTWNENFYFDISLFHQITYETCHGITSYMYLGHKSMATSMQFVLVFKTCFGHGSCQRKIHCIYKSKLIQFSYPCVKSSNSTT
jgi:hypothetical protein